VTGDGLGNTRRCAVLGSPIAHSLSPALHRAAYTELGLTNWSYDSFEVTEASLQGFVEGLDASWRGLSLTMPLKAAALALGDADPIAQLAGGANTLILDGSRRRLYNTDVLGLVWAVRQHTDRPLGTMTVLGTGATARSTVVAASWLKASRLTVLARTTAKAQSLVSLGRRLGIEVTVLDWPAGPPRSDLLVSTVPSGVAEPLAEEAAASAPLVFDVLYHPWPTALAVAAEAAGSSVIGGLDLLVGQALQQIELMTGRTVAPDVLYEAGRAALSGRTA
jgi:shikimate dehydrogenase